MTGGTYRSLASAGLSVLLCAAATISVRGDLPASFKVDLEPRQVEVGDRITATLLLVWMGERPSSTPRFPSWRKTNIGCCGFRLNQTICPLAISDWPFGFDCRGKC